MCDGEDSAAIGRTLEALVDRWAGDGLPDVVLDPAERTALHRRTRAGELAAVLQQVAR